MTKTKQAALDLYRELKDLEKEYEKACKKAFPAMSLVEYEHGSHIRTARVVSHNHGSMRVVGVTGRQYDLAYYFPLMLLEKENAQQPNR